MALDNQTVTGRLSEYARDRLIDEELARTRLKCRAGSTGSGLIEFSKRLPTWEMLLIIYRRRGEEIRSIGSLIEEMRCKPMTDRALYKFFEDQVIRGNIIFEATGPARRRIGLAPSLQRELEDYLQRASLLDADDAHPDITRDDPTRWR